MSSATMARFYGPEGLQQLFADVSFGVTGRQFFFSEGHGSVSRCSCEAGMVEKARVILPLCDKRAIVPFHSTLPLFPPTPKGISKFCRQNLRQPKTNGPWLVANTRQRSAALGEKTSPATFGARRWHAGSCAWLGRLTFRDGRPVLTSCPLQGRVNAGGRLAFHFNLSLSFRCALPARQINILVCG